MIFCDKPHRFDNMYILCTSTTSHLINDEIVYLTQHDNNPRGVAVVLAVTPDEADRVDDRYKAGTHLGEVCLLEAVEVGN